jgi:C_GCAxxG_C_C family probable redox protein
MAGVTFANGTQVFLGGRMADRVEIAVQRFLEGFNCTQAVLSAFANEFDLPPKPALRIAASFGGGIARTGETCGAVTGALMVLGLRFGTTIASDTEAKDRMYGLAQEFLAQFKSRHGAVLCRDLLGCDVSTPQGLQMAKDKGLFTDRCPRLVADAVQLAGEMLKSARHA